MAALFALVGSKLASVKYVQLATDHGPAGWTLAPDFHSVDVAVEFHTEFSTTAIHWEYDDQAGEYGLIALEGTLKHSDAALSVDVSDTAAWSDLIGRQVSSVTEARWRRGAEQQDFASGAIIRLSGGGFVAVAAADYDVNRGELQKGGDGITVFFDSRAAEVRGLIAS